MDVTPTSCHFCPLSRSKEEGQIVKEAVCYPVPTHLAQKQNPWNDLYGHHTLSTVRRQASYFDPNVPKDDLDFVIKSNYDHQKDLFKNRQEVLYQPDVYDVGNTLVLKNRIKALPLKPMHLNHPLITTSQPVKENLDGVHINPGGIHVHATRHGYNVKPLTGGHFQS